MHMAKTVLLAVLLLAASQLALADDEARLRMFEDCDRNTAADLMRPTLTDEQRVDALHALLWASMPPRNGRSCCASARGERSPEIRSHAGTAGL